MEVSGRKMVQRFCEPCGDNGHKLLAAGFCVDCSEFLCRQCYIHHCRARRFRNHVLQDETSMPKTKQDSTPLKPDNENECSKHKGETIKFYCRSDRKFGCGSCIALDHHGCDKPIYIKEEYEHVETKLGKLTEQLECHLNKKDQNRTVIKTHHSKVVQDIRVFMTKYKDFFENLETSMITDANKLKDDDEQKMNDISTSCMTLKNDLQSMTSTLTRLQQTKQNKKLFIMMEEIGDQMKRIAMNIDQTNADNNVKVYSFVPEEQIENMIKTLTILGKLAFEKENKQTDILKTSEEDSKNDAEVNPKQSIGQLRQTLLDKSETDAAMEIEHFPFKLRQMSQSEEINVKSSTDATTADVTGIAFLPNKLILTDKANKKVKLFNATQHKLIFELNLSSRPQDITAINDHQVAMTMPEVKKIQMLSISNQNITLGQTIKVKGQWCGIVNNEGSFIVTFVKPAKIEIISTSGSVLVDKGTNGETLFEQPKYVALSLDKTQVYITDYGKHSMTCMTLDGEVISVYKYNGLRNPCGLTVEKAGPVYVVGQGNYSNDYIFEISGDCSKGEKLPFYEYRAWIPQSIAYCKKEDKPYVGQCNNNTIIVFQFTYYY